MDDFLHRLHAHDWAAEPRPEGSSPEDVPSALVAAWRGEPDAYDRLMAVLANNHAGVFHPVLLPAMPFLHDVLADAPQAGVAAVLALLDDFVYSFDVESSSPTQDRQREQSFCDLLVPIRQTAVAIAAGQGVFATTCASLVEGIDTRLRGGRKR